MRKIFLILAMIATTTLAFGQKSPATLKVGGIVQFPIAKSVDFNLPFYGETVTVTCQSGKVLGYTLSASYLQNKNRFVQVPVLAGVRYQLVKNVFVNAEAGASFYNSGRTQFTYSPSLSVQLGRVCIDQKFLSSIKYGRSTSSVGLAVSYRL